MQANMMANEAVSWGRWMLKTLSDKDKAKKALMEELHLQLILQGNFPKAPPSQVSRLATVASD